MIFKKGLPVGGPFLVAGRSYGALGFGFYFYFLQSGASLRDSVVPIILHSGQM